MALVKKFLAPWKLFFLFLLIASFVVFFYSWNSKYAFWNSLEKKVLNGSEKVLFYEITNFDWDVVCMIPPYALSSSLLSKEDAIKQIIGEASIGENQIKSIDTNDDSSWAFIFVKENKVVDVTYKGRSLFLYKRYMNGCIKKDSAAFIIQNDKVYIIDQVEGEDYVR